MAKLCCTRLTSRIYYSPSSLFVGCNLLISVAQEENPIDGQEIASREELEDRPLEGRLRVEARPPGPTVNSSTAHVGKTGRTSRLTSRARLLDATRTSISQHASVGDRSEPGRTWKLGQVYGRRGDHMPVVRARYHRQTLPRSRRSSPVVVFQVRGATSVHVPSPRESRVLRQERLPNGRQRRPAAR